MSSKDRLELRKFMQFNPAVPPEMREYFQVLDRDLRTNDIWSTTTTSTSSTTSTTSTTSSTTTAP